MPSHRRRDPPSPLTPEERAARRLARKRQLRRRRLGALGVVLVLVGLAAGLSAWASSSSGSPKAKRPTRHCRLVAGKPRTIRPPWIVDRRATVLVDSVLLGAENALKGNLRGWAVTVLGHPAIMLPEMERTVREQGRVAPLVIIGVGYNSLWEKDRLHYSTWAARFDSEATDLMTTLKRLGAQQLVWVTLREASRSVIPSNSLWQYDKYSWYFPYVNEQLRKLARRRRDLVLADWAAVSNRPGITYDAIHLDPDGQALMARTVRKAIETAAKRETRVIRPRYRRCTVTTA